MSLIVDFKKKLGEVDLIQDGETFSVGIYAMNGLSAFVNKYTDEDGVSRSQLVTFYADEQHLKNCAKHYDTALMLDGVTEVRLNLFYKQSSTMLKYFVKDNAYKVVCYYEVGPKE